ncbi:class I SAM-dependent methyltransferase [Lentibacillus sp. N15]|uniref:tRNA (adenine(22)-N(1))-methyltransferase n=1 Tax=Lentibacillus songyuanensis TaxID=3136161 RepID=UPI0031BAB29C
MPQHITLSDRLLEIANFLPVGAVFADIGSDHAYLPCYVCNRDITAQAIAGEVNEGPYNSARATVLTNQLADRIDVRLGNGLEVLRDNEVKQVVIAGMGGTLIRSILDAGKAKLGRVKRIIAQPNVDAIGVRKWLSAHQYWITDETIIEENGHFYEIIIADMCENRSSARSWTEQELFFGPVLLTKRPVAFFKKWQYEKDKRKRVIRQMKHAVQPNQEKIRSFEQELQWIQEVLQDG